MPNGEVQTYTVLSGSLSPTSAVGSSLNGAIASYVVLAGTSA